MKDEINITTATTKEVTIIEDRVAGGMVGFTEDHDGDVTRPTVTSSEVIPPSLVSIGLVKAPTKRRAPTTTKTTTELDTITKVDETHIDTESLLTNRVLSSKYKTAPSTAAVYEAPPEPFTVSASDRFSTLIAPSTTRLTLPAKLQLLQRIHSALETVLQLMADRDQPAVFHRAKKAAENIVGR